MLQDAVAATAQVAAAAAKEAGCPGRGHRMLLQQPRRLLQQRPNKTPRVGITACCCSNRAGCCSNCRTKFRGSGPPHAAAATAQVVAAAAARRCVQCPPRGKVTPPSIWDTRYRVSGQYRTLCGTRDYMPKWCYVAICGYSTGKDYYLGHINNW